MVAKMSSAGSIVGKNHKPKSQVFKQILAFVLGMVLIYFAFRGADINKTLDYARDINLFYVLIVSLSCIFSHFLRALRWLILLKPVAERRVSLFHSFYAVMVGYAVNVAIPRGGEIARLVSINRLEKIPIAGVLPTLLIDRLLDIVMLAFLIGLTLILLPDSMLDSFSALAFSSLQGKIPTIYYRFVCAGLLALAVIGLLLLPLTARIIRFITSIDLVQKKLPDRVMTKLNELTLDFEKGASCLNNPINYPLIAGLSVLMWASYGLNYYIMLFAFHLENLVSAKDCLITFTIGSVGVLIPTPGSAGSVHLLVQKGLELTSHLPQEQGLAFAAVYHVVAFVVAPCVTAAICLAIESLSRVQKRG